MTVRTETRMTVIGRGRGRIHLDAAAIDWTSDLSAVRDAIAPESNGATWMLTGGEPTLWAALPDAIELLTTAGVRVGVVSDGWSLADARVVTSLASRGLREVAIQLHAARSDAHDWITGVAGSARRAVAAVRVCRDAGLEVGGEIVLTKPGAAHLVETAGLFLRLGVRSITVRRLAARQVALSDVLGLMAPLVPSLRYLSAAARLVRMSGGVLFGAGFPACLALRVPELHRVDDVADEVVECGACAGRIPCRGAPADYVARFGSLELELLQSASGAIA